MLELSQNHLTYIHLLWTKISLGLRVLIKSARGIFHLNDHFSTATEHGNFGGCVFMWSTEGLVHRRVDSTLRHSRILADQRRNSRKTHTFHRLQFIDSLSLSLTQFAGIGILRRGPGNGRYSVGTREYHPNRVANAVSASIDLVIDALVVAFFALDFYRHAIRCDASSLLDRGELVGKELSFLSTACREYPYGVSIT